MAWQRQSGLLIWSGYRLPSCFSTLEKVHLRKFWK